MNSLQTEYKKLHRFNPGEVAAVAAGRNSFLIGDDDGTWVVDDENYVHTGFQGSLAVGDAPIILDEDGLKRLAPSGQIFKQNLHVDGLGITSILDMGIIALRGTDEIQFFEEATLVESREIDPRPNPLGDEITGFVGGFESVALTSSDQVLWYDLIEDKVFQVELHDNIHDVGFLDEYVVATTDSKLAAFNIHTGRKKWIIDAVDNISDRGRNRLRVKDQQTDYILPDGSKEGKSDQNLVIAESPVGSRRLRETSTGLIVFEQRNELIDTSISEPKLHVGERGELQVSIRNSSDTEEQRTMNVDLKGGEIPDIEDREQKPTTIELILSPGERIKKTIPIIPEVASLKLTLGDEVIPLTADHPQPEIDVDVVETQYTNDGPVADFVLLNTGSVSVNSIVVSDSDQRFYESTEELTPDDRQEGTIELPDEPGRELKLTVEGDFTEHGESLTEEVIIAIPEKPITADISFLDSDSPAIEIRLESDTPVSEVIHVQSPFGSIESEFMFSKEDIHHIFLQSDEVPVGDFDVAVQGDAGLLKSKKKTFTGKSPLQISRDLEFWPNIQMSDSVENIPKGEVITEKLRVSNASDEPLQDVRIISDGEKIEYIEEIKPDTEVVLNSKQALYQTGLPEYIASSKNEEVDLPETGPPTEGDLVVRGTVFQQKEDKKLRLQIKNHSDWTCEIKSIGVEGVGHSLSSNERDTTNAIPPGEVTIITESVTNSALPTRDNVVAVVEYSLDGWSLISQYTATIAPIQPVDLENILDINMQGERYTFSISVKNKKEESIQNVNIQYRREESSKWEEITVAESLESNKEKSIQILGLGPRGFIFPGTRKSEVMIEATLKNNQNINKRYKVHAESTLGSTDWVTKELASTQNPDLDQIDKIESEQRLEFRDWGE
jgi:hypothetical protein